MQFSPTAEPRCPKVPVSAPAADSPLTPRLPGRKQVPRRPSSHPQARSRRIRLPRSPPTKAFHSSPHMTTIRTPSDRRRRRGWATECSPPSSPPSSSSPRRQRSSSSSTRWASSPPSTRPQRQAPPQRASPRKDDPPRRPRQPSQPPPTPRPRNPQRPRAATTSFQTSRRASIRRQSFERLNTDELWYARNEIYARHGRGFRNSELQSYFNSKPWYTRNPIDPDTFDSTVALSTTEKQNADAIKAIEQARGSSHL